MTGIDKAIEEAKTDMMPFESWERLTGESSGAFAAFCSFRDLGAERNIRKAVESSQLRCGEKDYGRREGRYRVWRNWSGLFRWKERAADFDSYIEKLKQTELRKTIEAQGEKHRAVTGKMLDVVSKKLDTMNPDDLTQTNLTEWVQTAIKAEREAFQLNDGGLSLKQGELNFVQEFRGL